MSADTVFKPPQSTAAISGQMWALGRGRFGSDVHDLSPFQMFWVSVIDAPAMGRTDKIGPYAYYSVNRFT